MTGEGRSIGSPPSRRGGLRQGDDTSDPRRIGEILNPALSRLHTSDQARAYGAWARAAGDAVAANARPRSFARGVLTVECDSSIWAQELTYLGGQLLSRMTELDPAHPVRRFRFVARGSQATKTSSPAPDQEASPTKMSRRDCVSQRSGLDAAQEGAREVGDDRLRGAILAALGTVAVDPREAAEDGPTVNPKK